MEKTRILLVGVGGYAQNYVRELKEKGREGGLEVVGAADPYAEASGEYATLKEMGVPFFNTPEEFYQKNQADLAIISTPIPLHAGQTVCCMEHGSHVLVEKPIAATVADGQKMIEAREKTGKKLAIGFQWCYDPAMNAFQKDVKSGLYGEVQGMRALVLWPRNLNYYRRGSGWAGKKYDKSGAPIFDCVASNATAHYLENMLWVGGHPLTDIEVKTQRANPIETYDTIVLKGRVGPGKLLFIASHATGAAFLQEPMFEYVFEKGTATFGALGQAGSELKVTLKDGTEKSYGPSSTNGISPRLNKLWNMVDAIHGRAEIACTAEDAMLHARAMEDCFRLRPDAEDFPPDEVRQDDGMNWVPGLYERLRQTYITGL